MSMDNYGSEGGMMSEINVTPLVDVMLVLLTVFIVTAPLLMNSVSVKLPKVAATTSLQKMNDVKVSITKASDVYIDETKIAAPTLEAELKKRNSKGGCKCKSWRMKVWFTVKWLKPWRKFSGLG